MFVCTGTKFTDSRFPIAKTASGEWLRPEFAAAQAAGEFPMMQVPVLKLADGTKLAQSKAIERYLAKALKLAGASDVEAAHVDAVGELLVDVRGKLAAAKDDAAKDAAIIDLTRALSILERLATTGVKPADGHIVGSAREYGPPPPPAPCGGASRCGRAATLTPAHHSPPPSRPAALAFAVTLADIQLYAFFTYYVATHELKDRVLAALEAVPVVKAIVAAVAAIPAVAAWEAGRAARGEVF